MQVSVIIPAKDAADDIAVVVSSVLEQVISDISLNVIVVDDCSIDATADIAEEAGAIVVQRPAGLDGNPAAARNLGASNSDSEILIFLDADCLPRPDWLAAILEPFSSPDVKAVGGSLGLPAGLSVTARIDYYCGWYHAHEKSISGYVTHHPPTNLAVRRDDFLNTSGFYELQPVAYAHEELKWQAELLRQGGKIFFMPDACVDHYNRPGFKNLCRRNYRWGYSAIEAKAEAGTARFPILYNFPFVAILLALPLGPLSAIYICFRWLRVGVFEILPMVPAVLIARTYYGLGMFTGGLKWFFVGTSPRRQRRPRWE